VTTAVAGVPAHAGRFTLFRPAEWQLALPLGLTYAAFFVVPLLLLVAVSAFDDEKMTTIGFAQWRKFLGDLFYWKVIGDTVMLGVLTVAATALVGYPLALVYLEVGPFWQRVILFVVILPLLTSVVVRTFAWIVILGREGVINQAVIALGLVPAPLRLLQTQFGLVLALTQIEMPLMLLPLLNVMSRIDTNLRDASLALGASRWYTLFKVTIPLSLPGLVAGCMLVFASSTTAFISQSVIGGNRLVFLPLLIWQQSLVVYNWPLASVAALTLLISVGLGVMAIAAVGRRSRGYVHG
jgi:putative spermidine/putrescine transport system permease protein